MTQIMEIEQKISSLPQEEFRQIRNWILKQDAKIWDQEIEADVKSGKLDALAKAALKEYNDKQYKAL